MINKCSSLGQVAQLSGCCKIKVLFGLGYSSDFPYEVDPKDLIGWLKTNIPLCFANGCGILLASVADHRFQPNLWKTTKSEGVLSDPEKGHTQKRFTGDGKKILFPILEEVGFKMVASSTTGSSTSDAAKPQKVYLFALTKDEYDAKKGRL